MSFNSISKTLKAGLKGSAFFMLFFVFQAHADGLRIARVTDLNSGEVITA